MGDEQEFLVLTDVSMENLEPDPITEPRPNQKPIPRFEPINREQMVMRVIDVEQLVDQGHSVRAIWEFVGRLDLSSFCEQIRAVEGVRGRPTHHPRLMICLWIYAYSRGVSSGREIARLCEHDPAYQWLTGMKVVNHHSLSDFRVDHDEALNQLFVQILGVLTLEGLIDLERVMHDGTKIKTWASKGTFRGEKRVKEHLEIARRHIAEVDASSDEDTNRRAAKARGRAVREKQQRLESAEKEFKKIRASQSEGGTKKEGETKKKDEIRVSETEPEARIMKHRDGGFAPSYNAQISTDRLCGVIVGVGLSQSPTDYEELLGSVDRVEHNTGKLPVQVVADGGYTSGNNIHWMRERGVDFIAPVDDTGDEAFSRQAFVYDEGTNSYTCPAGKTLPYKGKERRGKSWRFRYRGSALDCKACPFKMQCCPTNKKQGRSVMRSEYEPEIESHAAKMQTEEAKLIYKQRGQTAEFPSAWIKEKLGVRRFRVRGLIKAGLEIIWACVTYNIQQWIRLRWRDQLSPAKT